MTTNTTNLDPSSEVSIMNFLVAAAMAVFMAFFAGNYSNKQLTVDAGGPADLLLTEAIQNELGNAGDSQVDEQATWFISNKYPDVYARFNAPLLSRTVGESWVVSIDIADGAKAAGWKTRGNYDKRTDLALLVEGLAQEDNKHSILVLVKYGDKYLSTAYYSKDRTKMSIVEQVSQK